MQGDRPADLGGDRRVREIEPRELEHACACAARARASSRPACARYDAIRRCGGHCSFGLLELGLPRGEVSLRGSDASLQLAIVELDQRSTLPDYLVVVNIDALESARRRARRPQTRAPGPARDSSFRRQPMAWSISLSAESRWFRAANNRTVSRTFGGGTGQLLVRAASNGTSLALTAGSIQGAIEARDIDVAGLRKDLNTLASTLISQVNSVHAQGFGLNGTTGTHFSREPPQVIST